MKILIVSDAWHPQVNGVVRTLQATERELQAMGHAIRVHGPDPNLWHTVAMPSYPSIKLEFLGRMRLQRVWNDFEPDFIHIATEGPLGWAARNLCLAKGRPFTTSYHTRFPEYIAARMMPGLRKATRVIAYAALRRFHAPASAVMVATSSIERDLKRRKFRHIVHWSRGVDTALFAPHKKSTDVYAELPRPVLLSVGRVSVEKNLRAFLDCKVPGSKIVIGDGPDLESLKAEYPDAHFLGVKEGEELARHFAAADIFVFPSTTDTFGLVLLEACAAGLRIASYPAPGPADIFAPEDASAFAAIDDDLERAIHRAMTLSDDRSLPRRFAEGFSWEACTRVFYDHLQASTPKAVKRITRFRNWMGRWWQRALALTVRRWHS